MGVQSDRWRVQSLRPVLRTEISLENFFVQLNLRRVDHYLFPAPGSEVFNHTLMLQFKSYNKVLMKLKLVAVAIVGYGGLIYLT